MQRLEPLFFLRELSSCGESAILSDEEAQHAAGARRLNVSDTLHVFDGHGVVCRAMITDISDRKKKVHLRLGERRTVAPPRPAVHLACALPKGDRQTVLLDMATQLGMQRFTPLVCSHSVVKSGAHAITRWTRICLEACKQSRRAYLPEFSPPASPDEVTRQTAAEGGILWIAHPSPDALSPFDRSANPLPDNLTILIGPEGGFTEEEVARVITAGGKPISLGSVVLRIETAATALLASVMLRSG